MKKILLLLMTMSAFGLQNVSAQDAPLKIVTGHPDFKIQIKRCAASGSTVVIDMVLSNVGAKDIDAITLYGSPAWNRGEVYDDEGNIYSEGNGKKISLQLTNVKEYFGWIGPFRILSDVPMRLSVRIEDFSTTAERIALLQLGVDCAQWGLENNKSITIRNIPISRD